MKKLFLGLTLLMLSNVASAAITNFDISCSIYLSLVPKKDANKMWNYRQDDAFRLKVENGYASMAHGTGPGTQYEGKPIKWVTLFKNVKAKVTSTRWTTQVVIPAGKGRETITIDLTQGSRANKDGHFVDGIFEIPSGVKLEDGSVITKFDAGFCFDFEG